MEKVMDAFLNDIRYAIRNLIKRPGFTLIAVLTLSIGIGAITAMFSAIHALLMIPLEFPDLDRAVAVWEKNSINGRVHDEVTVGNYVDWRDQSQSFETLALYSGWSMNLSGVDSPERIQDNLVNAKFMYSTSLKQILGRKYTRVKNETGK